MPWARGLICIWNRKQANDVVHSLGVFSDGSKTRFESCVLAGPRSPSLVPVVNLCSGSVFLVVTDLVSSHSCQPLPDIEASHGAAILWSVVPTGGHVEGSYPLLGKDTAPAILMGASGPHPEQYGPLSAEDRLSC